MVYQNAASCHYFGGSLLAGTRRQPSMPGLAEPSATSWKMLTAGTARNIAANVLPALLALDTDAYEQALEALIMEQVRGGWQQKE